MMRNNEQQQFKDYSALRMIFSLLCYLIIVVGVVETKSTIEPCNSTKPCPSLLSYLLPCDSMLSEIATRFNVNVSDIMAANSAFPITPSCDSEIVRAGSTVKIPATCECVDGIRRSVSAVYRVEASDTLESISQGYGGLVSADQIRSVNNGMPLLDGDVVVIPLPCSCMKNKNNGRRVVYMSYVVQKGETLESVASYFGTTLSDLESVNGLGQPTLLPGDILYIPIPATLNWYNERLMVPNGSYALTANNCIKCTCSPNDLKMQCFPSGMDVPCYNLRCKGSNLAIGDEHLEYSNAGCNVTQCVYRGHKGGKILSSLINSSYLQCPDNISSSGAKCWPPSAPYFEGPFVLSPSPSPTLFPLPVSEAALMTRAFDYERRLHLFSFIYNNMLLLFFPMILLCLLM
ncbi:hypothetical protein PIB30_065379 [Stylosanthes scabra]|uniref:LysM domain-containing protein n=1 Tax=Stylosanthes scabra TaxID=79078 RepID=A0ABU6QMT5_9FABA|nr:hypothetical protein [Stylosanthes scabra]